MRPWLQSYVLTLKNTLAEMCEPFSVFVPLAIQRAGIVFSLVGDPFPRGLRQRLCCAHSDLPLGRVLQHLSVTHDEFSRVHLAGMFSRVQFLRLGSGTSSARTHVPPTYHPNMTPCHHILHCMLHEATDVPIRGPVFAHMKVVQWVAQPAGVAQARQGRQHSPAQQSEGARWPEQIHEPLPSNPAALSSWEELGTRTADARIQTGQHPDRSVPLMSSSDTSPTGDRTHQ